MKVIFSHLVIWLVLVSLGQVKSNSHNIFLQYLENKNYDEGLKYFLSKAGSDNKANWYVGKLYYLQKKYNDSYKYYLESYENGNKEPEFFYDLALLSFRNDDRFSFRFKEKNINKVYGFWRHYINQDYHAAISEISQVGFIPQLIYPISRAYFILGKSNIADSLIIITKNIATKNNDKRLQALCMISEVTIASLLSKKDKLKILNKATKLNDRYNFFRINNLLLGYSGINESRPKEKIKYYKKAIQASSLCGDDISALRWSFTLIENLIARKEYAEALNLINTSENIINKFAINRFYFNIDKLKMMANKDIGNDALALTFVNKLLKREPNNPYFLVEKVLLLQNSGSHVDAIRSLNSIDTLNLDPTLKSYFAYLKGESYQRLNAFKKALKSFKESNRWALISGYNDYIYYSNFKIVDSFVSLNQNDSAIGIMKNINIKKDNIHAKDILSVYHQTFGNLFFNINEIDSSIFHYKKANWISEKLRIKISVPEIRIGYFSQTVKAYRNILKSYAKKYYKTGNASLIDSMLTYYLKSKDKSLQDSFIDREKGNEYFDYYNNSKNQLSKLQRLRRKNIEKDFNFKDKELENKIYNHKIDLLDKKMLLGKNYSLGKKFALPELDGSETFIGFFIEQEHSFTIVFNKDIKEIIPLKIDETMLASHVSEMIKPFHHFKGRDNISFNASSAFYIYEKIIKPIESLKGLTMNWRVLPDKFLYGLPFDILLLSNQNKHNYSIYDKPEYIKDLLIQRYNISTYVFNPQIKDQPGLTQRVSVLIMSNPFELNPLKKDMGTGTSFRYGNSILRPLIYAEKESKKVKQYFKNSLSLSGKNANIDSLKNNLGKYNIIHFATHAFADTTFSAFSGILLHPSKEDTLDDGLLMGYEISNFNLKADLVTLSACETGYGKVINGEGVMGLPRLFIKAGAKSVLSTLWNIDDRFTSQIMPQFYKYLVQDKFSKSQSLFLAKKKILELRPPINNVYYQHPFFWASFSLYGDTGKLTGISISDILLISLFILIQILSLYFIFIRRLQLDPLK